MNDLNIVVACVQPGVIKKKVVIRKLYLFWYLCSYQIEWQYDLLDQPEYKKVVCVSMFQKAFPN